MPKDEKEVKKQKETLRDKILKVKDIEEDIVEVKEWGGIKIKVMSLTVEERNKVRDSAETKLNSDGTVSVNRKKLEIAALIAGAKDPETGSVIFTDKDMDLLLKKNARAVDTIATRILELSGMGPEAGELRKRSFQGK